MQLLTKQNRTVLGIGVFVVLAVCGYFFYAALQTKPSASDNNTLSATKKKEAIYADITKAKAQLDAAKTDDQKAAAYKQLANLYVNTLTEKSVAITYAQKLVDLSGTSENYAQLGFTYAQAGDKKQAIAAYQKAASLTKNKVDDGRSDYSYYLQQAKALGA